jgi:hypothetical protein
MGNPTSEGSMKTWTQGGTRYTLRRGEVVVVKKASKRTKAARREARRVNEDKWTLHKYMRGDA